MQGHRFGAPASTAGRPTFRLPSLLLARKSGIHPPVRSSFPRWMRVSSQLMSGIFAWNVLLAVPLQAHAQDVQTQKSAPVKPYAGIKSTIKPTHLPNRLSLPADCLVPLPVTASSAKQVRLASLSLLNDTGNMARPVSVAQISTWRTELAANTLSRRGIALRHLWIGEWQMAHDENLIGAQSHFDTAAHLTAVKDKVRGLAVYDTAVDMMLAGRYEKARVSFEALLKSHKSLSGFNAATCSLWARHARACAGYHAERAKLGIVEPERLDPNCGAAALGMWLRANNLPYDQATVVKAVRPTGRGSKTREVEAGAERLGLETKTVAADEAALPYLPKPLMAFVEHDHFLAVTGTDKAGVTYNCSDCGKWPGGYQHITWAQWHKLEATEYTLFAKPFTAQASLIESIPIADKFLNTQGGNVTETPHSRTWRRHHVCAIPPSGMCGSQNYSQQCDSAHCCPMDTPGGSDMNFGASAGDPVNLATLQEEYKPASDLTVYNPTGPSVSFQRQYYSLRQSGSYIAPFVGLGTNWTHNYSVHIECANPHGPSATLCEPNGAEIPITMPRTPTATDPIVPCSVPKGYPMQVYFKWNISAGATYFDIVYADRTHFTTTVAWTLGQRYAVKYALAQITDRAGNYIQLVNSHAINSPNWRLTQINDNSGNVLITLNYDASSNLTSIADRYGRSVVYQCGGYPEFDGANTYNVTELSHVSQIVPTGTVNPPDRYAYGYGSVSNFDGYENFPLLNAISVPSPTGTGTATARIEYAPGTMWVSALVDANGNRREYSNVPGSSATKVTVKQNTGGGTFATNYVYTAGYDANMSGTTVTNGAVDGNGNNTTIVSSKTFADPNDPNRPSQEMDGNGYAVGGANGKGTWSYTWDQFGNCTSTTTPRGTTTTNTIVYTNFALGELKSIQEGSRTPTTYTYYEPSGLTQTVTKPKPGTVGTGQTVITSFTYDALGNIQTIVAPAPNNTAGSTLTTTYNYTTDGAFSQNAALDEPLTETDNLGHVTHYRYDVRGNRSAEIDALGNETDDTYTIAGQLLAETLPATGQTGVGRSYVLASYSYTGGPLLTSTSYDESGSAFRQLSYAYGAEGESLSTTGNTVPSYATYDALYRRKSISDGTHSTTINYNPSGYVSSVIYPGTDSHQYNSYDANGNVLQRTDGRSIVTNYIYNDLESRLTDIQYPTSASLNIHYVYDSYGQRKTVTDGTGAKGYTYDDIGALTDLTTTYTGLPVRDISYSFYPDGSRQSMTTPAGAFNYTYDGNTRATSLTNPYGESFAWTYLNNNWLWTQQIGNAAVTTYTYNAGGQVTEMANRKTDASHTLLSDFGSLHYNAAQNCTSVTANLPLVPTYSGQTNYAYSTRDQLNQEQSARNGAYTNGYGYDPSGNPTTFKSLTSMFNVNNQNTAYTYDGDGNPTTYKATTLAFDVEDRLTSVGSALTTGYDLESRRAWKQSSTGRTYFLYDGDDLVCELSATGAVTAVNTFGDNGLLARHISAGSVLYTFDTQDNVAQKLDVNGNVLSSSMFDSFGTIASTAAVTDPFTYRAQSGYYTDTETGLLLLGQRYYDTSTGRFLTRDPMGSNGGLNLYSYVGNNPANSSDPSGLIPTVVCAGAKLKAKIIAMLKDICYRLDNMSPGKLGGGTVNATCVKNWCSKGTVRCSSESLCTPPNDSVCAKSRGGPDSGLNPGADNHIEICDNFLFISACKNAGMCSIILHEVAGDCGSTHKNPKGGPGYIDTNPPTDPCQVYSKDLCKRMGLH